MIRAFKVTGASVVKSPPLDLIVSWGSRTYLIEVKDGSKPPSQQKLTEAEAKFIAAWNGGVWIVRHPSDARVIFDLNMDADRFLEMQEEVQHIRSTPLERLRKEGLVKA